jgi:hypothetical protein
MQLGSVVLFEIVILMERLHRLLAALLLLVYASTGTASFSGLTLVLAELEGRHEVRVSETAVGTRVLFHHELSGLAPSATDQECTLDPRMAEFSMPDHEGDHALSSAHLIGSLNSSSEEIQFEVKEPRDIEPLFQGGHLNFGNPNFRFALAIFGTRNRLSSMLAVRLLL